VIAFLKSKRTERLVAMVLVPILLLYALWLPPVSIGERLFGADYSTITPAEGGTVMGPAGASLQVPGGAVEKRTRIRIKSLSDTSLSALALGNPGFFASADSKEMVDVKADSAEHVALQSLPADVANFAPFYRIDVRGDAPKGGLFSAPVPYELANVERADVFGWDGQAWQWLPSQATPDGLTLHVELSGLPTLLMVAETQAMGSRVAVGASGTDTTVPDDLDPTYVNLEGFYLKGDGSIDDSDAPAPASVPAAPVILSISNVIDGVARSDLTDNILVSSDAIGQHVDNILALAASYSATGVEIAYSGIDPALREDLNTFVAQLGTALRGQGRLLTIRVDAPRKGGESWDTGAYDWPALSRSADLVRLPVMTSPDAYADGADMDSLLTWATGMMDRRRIDLAIDAHARMQSGGRLERLSYSQALGLLAQEIESENADGELLPGEVIRLGLADSGSALLGYHSASQIYTFELSGAGTVWLENAASVARKLQFVDRYALGGVSVSAMLDRGNDPEVMRIVRTFREDQPREPRFALVWTAEDGTGRVLTRQVKSLDNAAWAWRAPRDPGSYVIKASISDDGGETALDAGSQLAVVVPTLTLTPTPEPSPTVEPSPTAAPTNTPAPSPTPDPNAPPTATPQPAAPAPAPAVAAGSAGRGFGYGIQVHMVDQGDVGRILDHVQMLGFGWVKQQVEWKLFNPAPGQYNWGALDHIVEACNARGLRIMFSVVKAPKWARPGHTDFSVEGPPADPQTYAAFVGAMAERYRGRVHAYEIWNEQNLHYEWGNEPIDAARYMQLLRLAYNAIKAQDRNATVVSGALTPTGAPPPWAIDDMTYLDQMYRHGLKNYCDAVGAHPSGYNIPPNVPWPGYNDPTAGFRGPFEGPGAGHPSWSFQSTMTGYRNIMLRHGDGAKRIWPTEFGWASVENLGVPPAHGYEYAADNTEAEQAQYLVQAYQMARSWGWSGPMFTWNLNFAPVAGNAWEGSAFGIVRGDWSPRPAFHALRDMPK
jgi:cell division septation protein DedD